MQLGTRLESMPMARGSSVRLVYFTLLNSKTLVFSIMAIEVVISFPLAPEATSVAFTPVARRITIFTANRALGYSHTPVYAHLHKLYGTAVVISKRGRPASGGWVPL